MKSNRHANVSPKKNMGVGWWVGLPTNMSKGVGELLLIRIGGPINKGLFLKVESGALLPECRSKKHILPSCRSTRDTIGNHYLFGSTFKGLEKRMDNP